MPFTCSAPRWPRRRPGAGTGLHRPLAPEASGEKLAADRPPWRGQHGVLLNELERMVAKAGLHTVPVEAHEEKPLAALLVPHLRKLFFEMKTA